MGVRALERARRFQQLAIAHDGYVARAPRLARVIDVGDGDADEAAAAVVALAAPFAPSEELANIDEFVKAVLLDPERVETWRLPKRELELEASPVPWMTTGVREAIEAAVTPLLLGVGALRAELESRFLRAVHMCGALSDFSTRGGVPSADSVQELVRAGF